MYPYIIKRIATLPLLLFVLSVVIFSLVGFLTPSQRLAVFYPEPDYMQNISAEDLLSRYGLDQPAYLQYGRWLQNIIKGDLGWSQSARMPVGEVLRMRVPATIELLFVGIFIATVGGLLFGTIAAVYHNRTLDYIIRIFIVLSSSLPGFFLGLILLIFFYAYLGIASPGRLSLWAQDIVYSSQFINYTGMNVIDALMNKRLDIWVDSIKHIILPSIAFSTGILATAVRIFRSSVLVVLKEDYIKTARAKGLAEKIVIYRHAFKNALLPFITFIGMQIPTLFGGVVIIETVFNYQGMGRFIVTAALGLDFSAILGASISVGTIIILSNLLVDLLYLIFDPRISMEW